MNDIKILTDSSAFLISRAYKHGVHSQLGKTKLYKMLFMASWQAFSESLPNIYIGQWYRIDKGPALAPINWETLTVSLDRRFGIEAQSVVMWHGHPQVCFSKPKSSLPKSLGKYRIECLSSAFDSMINLTAPEAAAMTYKTPPMLWLLAEERFKWGGSVQYRYFSFDDAEREKFMSFTELYRQGSIDIPDIVNAMGADWNNHRVSIYLDTFNIHRSIDNIRITASDRKKLLLRIVKSFKSQKPIHHASPEEMAVASSRLEGEYFSPNSLLD